MGQGGAMKSAAGQDSELGFENRAQVRRLKSVDAQAEYADPLVRGAGTKPTQAGTLLKAFHYAFTQLNFMRANGLDPPIQQPRDTSQESRDTGHIRAAGFEAIRKKIGLLRSLARGTGSALAQRCDFDLRARPQNQHASAKRPEQSFMARARQRVDREIAKSERQVTDRLSAIHEAENLTPPADLPDFCDRLDRAGDIAGVRDDNQSGGRANGRGDYGGIYDSRFLVGFNGRPFQSGSRGQAGKRSQHRVVFECSCYDMVAGLDQPFDQRVQCIGAVESKDDWIIEMAIEQTPDGATAAFESLPSIQRFAVPAPPGARADVNQLM